MSVRSVIVVALSIVCGVSAAVGMNQLRSGPVAVRVQPETTPVVVVRTAVRRGRTVSEEMVEVRDCPKDWVLEGALTKIEDAVGRAALASLVPSEPLLDAKLAPKRAGRGLAPLIPLGMRAYTIHTARAASNVAGFILPDNRVDVILTLKGNYNEQSGGATSTTLLQAVEILACDQSLDAPTENVNAGGLQSVTLLVTPKQAALLDLAQNMGQLTLSLRNPEDTSPIDAQATLAQLRYRQEAPKAAPAEFLEPVPTEEDEDNPPVLGENPKLAKILTFRGEQAGLVLIQLD